jgi:hypothetical protein
MKQRSSWRSFVYSAGSPRSERTGRSKAGGVAIVTVGSTDMPGEIERKASAGPSRTIFTGLPLDYLKPWFSRNFKTTGGGQLAAVCVKPLVALIRTTFCRERRFCEYGMREAAL